METDDPSNWRTEDRYPGKEINSISPLSERLYTVYARINDKRNIVPKPMHIFAIIFMVKGLEYHYENFKRLVNSVTFPPSGLRSEVDTLSLERAKLEAMAYINTIGQLYYWADRYFSPDHTRTTSTAPIITRVTGSFRHKYSAHLSIDKHHREDSERARSLHLFAFIGGILWDRDGNMLLQIQRKENEIIEFNLINEHALILEEVQSIFQAFLVEGGAGSPDAVW